MELTFIGIIQLMVGGLIILAGGLRSVFLFLMISSLFSGSAAILLPALGGSSIPPVQFALLFVYLRILAPRGGFVGTLPNAIRANSWLILFTFYGMASAFIAPRLFAGTIDVFPMSHQNSRGMFDTLPLQPTSQNITASVYLLGTLLTAMAAWIVCRYRGGVSTVISGAIAIGWLHIAIGLAAVVTRGTPADIVFEIFRNGTYAYMDDSWQGFVRIRGIFPETSSYTVFAFAWFVLNAELWYRSVRPGATGPVAFALAVILFFSTSSTAYIGLAGYLAFFVLRILPFPNLSDGRKIKAVAVSFFGIVFVTAIMLAVIPSLPQAIWDMVLHMTVEKSDSGSGQQRMFWAMQGWRVFFESWGLGIGPGSFRSSSIITAMLGSVGFIGVAAFLAYLHVLVQPWKRSTWAARGDLADRIGATMATAAVLSLIPAAISSSDAVPGTSFAIMAGAALALRPVGRKATRGRADALPFAQTPSRTNGEPATA